MPAPPLESEPAMVNTDVTLVDIISEIVDGSKSVSTSLFVSKAPAKHPKRVTNV